jgi:hypothetical protein
MEWMNLSYYWKLPMNHGRFPMPKKYIVRLSDEERETCSKGTSEKVRRAQVLLKANLAGPAWTDQKIAEAFSCRVRTVEKIRQRFVQQGFEQALDRQPSLAIPANKLLNGKQQAKIIALRLGPAPKGYSNWTLRLLARQVVALEIVESISHETVRGTLKKTA